jgi:hypothetical protein
MTDVKRPIPVSRRAEVQFMVGDVKLIGGPRAAPLPDLFRRGAFVDRGSDFA